ncbi:hypothetical protein DPEC_G00278390 [Dallia pectoralis]|uniref:Uncharacterized protein n=1 Tax=Dallia pectoralis TaxID=75939 RepID=A0ACC2FM38_DALPE|nr:hypothetical protein DPEC_G00278390 [Dallia pectoralis]
MSAIKALQQWCKVKSSGYRDVNVTNMTTSFRDGLAFCALIHKHKPDLIDFDSLKKEDVFYNNQLAFRVAEEKLGIPALLDAEDMVALRIPDRLSILTYVSQYYNYFNGRCPIGGMGGIKRPAEGSKEEPSEKKNLPVVRTATEIPTHSCTVLVKTAPRAVALDKEVLVASTNKIATLGSKCVVCKCHVHLVQRHFIEGRLYHRSCFRCCECSKVLLAGAYKPYGESGSFICSHHRSSCRPPSPVSVIQTVPPTSTVDPKSDESVTNSASALLIPIAVTLKPTAPAAVPDPQPWTSSAQKTQAARQRFFQSSHSAPARTLGSQKPMISSSIPKVSLSVEEDKVRARAVITKKLAEANRNNNNTRYFVVRPAERLSDVPRSAELLRAVPTEHGPTTATQPAAQSSARSSADKESRLLDADKASAKPTTISSTTKGKDADRSEAPGDWRSKLKPVQKGRGLYIRIHPASPCSVMADWLKIQPHSSPCSSPKECYA